MRVGEWGSVGMRRHGGRWGMCLRRLDHRWIVLGGDRRRKGRGSCSMRRRRVPAKEWRVRYAWVVGMNESIPSNAASCPITSGLRRSPGSS